ncbi:hypothetical protein CH371_19835 [Leptospira wolffii]|uniref:ABC-three component systems C-terminal domain-containing protein n=1 Tax=Leptospira wolffii TaxID=409998 RepID=A0A2M9Z6W8_9LEPT|nr:ABC-three component system protein [Leptospira wolffii]PJZ64117.1 hypothetical protein CH371_19835 [Leptospira wolffii]
MGNNPKQSIEGDGNQQAGRDIFNVNISTAEEIKFIFYEKDIAEVIVHFDAQKTKVFNGVDNLERIDIEEKNQKNNLSPTYFEFIEENSLSSFKRMDAFLRSPGNQEFLEMYRNTTTEIQHKILSSGSFTAQPFEKVLAAIYEGVMKNAPENIKKQRTLVLKFIHYMYWNCDIGLK